MPGSWTIGRGEACVRDESLTDQCEGEGGSINQPRRTSLRERMSFAAASVGSGLGPEPDSSFDTALQKAIAALLSESESVPHLDDVAY